MPTNCRTGERHELPELLRDGAHGGARDRASVKAKSSSDGEELPVVRYDALNERDALAELPGLTQVELARIEAFENRRGRRRAFIEGHQRPERLGIEAPALPPIDNFRSFGALFSSRARQLGEEERFTGMTTEDFVPVDPSPTTPRVTLSALFGDLRANSNLPANRRSSPASADRARSSRSPWTS